MSGRLLGLGDWERARELLVDGRLSTEGALAVAALVCWLVMLAVGLLAAFWALRRARASGLWRRRGVRAAMCLAAGMSALLAGTLHHQAERYSMCCGGDAPHLQEARSLAR